MTEQTPTTADVRNAYAAWAFDPNTGSTIGVAHAERAFDTWLAEHDDEIRADMQICTAEAAYCQCGRRPGHTGQHRCRDCGSWPTCNPNGMRPPPTPIVIKHEPERVGLWQWLWSLVR